MFHTNTCIHKQILTPKQNLARYNMILWRITHLTSYVCLFPRPLQPSFLFAGRNKANWRTFSVWIAWKLPAQQEKTVKYSYIIPQVLFVAGTSPFRWYTRPKNCIFVLKLNDKGSDNSVRAVTFHALQLRSWAYRAMYFKWKNYTHHRSIFVDAHYFYT